MAQIAKRTLITLGLIAGFVLFAVFMVTWVISLGLDETKDSISSPPATSDSVPADPNQSTIEGGQTGVGTGTSNDENISRPSPAGGVDTNNQRTE